MIPSRLIERKRDGEAIPVEELRAFLNGYLAGDVEEYQMSAFLMATIFRGLDADELSGLLAGMIESGATLELGHLPGPRVDKHSTGGVGDKASIPLAPLAASLGLFVPMMSGRGLGHTGGTLDKLEAIPGFRTAMPLDEFARVLERVGCAMIGQTAEIAPLDRRLYDLRSVTGTVPCIPLIAASIMSKKLSEGLNGLVLDVKVGEGAFLPERDRGLDLARTMVELGKRAGVRTTARMTAMDQPLGLAIGNALEISESMACLEGRGPADLRELVVELAAEMLIVGGLETELKTARVRADGELRSGRPRELFMEMVTAQGGSTAYLLDPALHRVAPEQVAVHASRSGIIQAVSPLTLGRAVVSLGGGRARLGEQIDPRVGFDLAVKVGDAVSAGQPLGWVHAAGPDGLAAGQLALREAILLGDEVAPSLPLFMDRLN